MLGSAGEAMAARGKSGFGCHLALRRRPCPRKEEDGHALSRPLGGTVASPRLIGDANWIHRQVSADAIVEVVWTFDDEVVVVLVEGNRELV